MIIGIDPGKSGGVSIIYEEIAQLNKCPTAPIEMSLIISNAINTAYIENKKITTYIENVHAFPTDGRSSAFKFGCNYGMWLGILASNRITPIKVIPFKWMESFGNYSKVKQERKRQLKEKAIEQLSRYTIKGKVTLSTADAALISIYGRNKENEDEGT